VGKSKLRQKEPPALGPEYRGSKISRGALADDNEEDEEEEDEADGSDENMESELDEWNGQYAELDDAETALNSDADADEEIDSDEAFGDADEEKYKDFSFSGSSRPATNGRGSRRPVASDFLTSSEDGEDEQRAVDLETAMNGTTLEKDKSDSNAEDGLDLADEDAETATDSAGDFSDQEDKDNNDRSDEDVNIQPNGQEPKLQPQTITSLSQAAERDVERGRAIRQQRKTFDSLLNLRIRLQKALVSANSLAATSDSADAAENAVSAAEQAAITLLNSLSDIQDDLSRSRQRANLSQGKRKRAIEPSMTAQEIWSDLQTADKSASGKRRKTLEAWSTRAGNIPQPGLGPVRQLGPQAGSSSVTRNLDDQLQNMDRLVKRTQRPRSCAPIQAARTKQEDPTIYDDADFYQLLLKELVDQRAGDPSVVNGTAVTTVSWAAIKEARTRKNVDRKASKGRKMRFNVHEKLQNFMAPEDRRSWEEEAIDRFFKSLFGNKSTATPLADQGSDEEMAGAGISGRGLKLFGS
jgi:protein AATF/BFR2